MGFQGFEGLREQDALQSDLQAALSGPAQPPQEVPDVPIEPEPDADQQNTAPDLRDDATVALGGVDRILDADRQNVSDGDVPPITRPADETAVSERVYAGTDGPSILERHNDGGEPGQRVPEQHRDPDTRALHVMGDEKQPDTEGLIKSFRSGGTERVIATKFPDGPLRVEGTRNVFPPSAMTRDVAAGSAEDAVARGERAEGPLFAAWARIVRERSETGEAQGRPSPASIPQEEQQAGIDVGRVAASAPVRLIYQGEGMSLEHQEEICDKVDIALHNATENEDSRSVELLSQLDSTLRSGPERGVVRMSAAVGALTEQDLQRVASEIERTALVSGRNEVWIVERNDMGGIVVHPNDESALAPKDRGAHLLNDDFVTPEGWAGAVLFPDREVYGVPEVPNYQFAVNQRIPEGSRTISVAWIRDNGGGKRVAPLRIPEDEGNLHEVAVGGSGSGKTTLIRLSTVEERVSDRARHEEARASGVEWEPPGSAVLDAEKSGNYAQPIADMLKARGLSGEWATVHHADVGAPNAVRVNFNPFKLPGVQPSESVKLAVETLAIRLSDPRVQQVFAKWLTKAADRSYTDLGMNMETGRSKYPYGSPPTPTVDHVKVNVGEVVRDGNLSRDFSADSIGWTEGEAEGVLRGAVGLMLRDGYDINWEKFVHTRGVPVVDLGRLANKDGQRLATAMLFNGVFAQLRAENPGVDVNEVRQRLKFDEAFGLFSGDNPLGIKNAERFKVVRGIGGVITLAGQGGVEQLSTDVTDNIGRRWALRSNSLISLAVTAQLLGNTDPQAAASYLSTTPDADTSDGRPPRGFGLYFGADSTPYGAVRFEVPDPREMNIVQGSGEVKGPEELLDLGRYRKFYSGETITDAKDMLMNTPNGNRLLLMLGQDVVNVLTGREPGDKQGGAIDYFRKMAEDNPDVVDCLIDIAADEAARSRPDGQYVAPHEEYRDHVRAYVDAQIKGTDPPEQWPLSKVLDMAYYNRVLDKVRAAMIAPRHENSSKFAEALKLKGLPGATAEEQLNKIKELQGTSIEVLTRTIESQTGRTEIDETDLKTAVTEFSRIAGKDSTQKIVDKLQRRLGRALSQEESAVLAKIAQQSADEVQTDDGSMTNVMGYDEVRQELENSIKAHKDAGAVDLKDFETEYGEKFPSGGKARDQEEYMVAKQETKTRVSAQETDYARLLIAPDFLRGGRVADNVIELLMKRAEQQGPLERAVEDAKKHNTSRSLPDLLLSKDTVRTKLWGSLIATELLMSETYVLPDVVSKAWVDIFSADIRAARGAVKD